MTDQEKFDKALPVFGLFVATHKRCADLVALADVVYYVGGLV